MPPPGSTHGAPFGRARREDFVDALTHEEETQP